MTNLLNQEAIRARIAQQQQEAARVRADNVQARYEYVRPFLSAANDLVDWMTNPEGRLMFTLDPLDAAIRGIGRGELCYITGKAHSGKTQLVLHLLRHNRDKRILYFTPDEVDSLVLTKLVALEHGVGAEMLEERIKSGDVTAINLVRRTAEETFGNLLVIDSSLTLSQMMDALNEAQDFWGEMCDAVCVDYLDLIPGDVDYTGTKGKSTGLKRWTKTADVATVCIHQPKRTGAKRGQSIGMDDMNMGGETEGTYVLGVFRKRDDEDLDMVEQMRHRDTLTVHISKNKRPPCKVGTFDFHLDSNTGRLRELRAEDAFAPGMPMRSRMEAQAAREWQRRTGEHLEHDPLEEEETAQDRHPSSQVAPRDGE